MAKTFIPTELQLAFAERVKQRRSYLLLSQRDLARKMTELDRKHRTITVWNVQGYERGHIPYNFSLLLLCEALKVTLDYLLGVTHLGDVDWDKSLVVRNDGSTPLSREDLQNYGGLPVWVRPKDDRSAEYCALVDDVHYALVSLQHGSVPFDDIDGTVWVEPSFYRDDILSREEAEAADRVFILPVRASFDAKRLFRGWYVYDAEQKMFVAEERDWVFSASEYGIRYIGFRAAKLIY